MCFEFDYRTQRQRAEEARKAQQKKAEERAQQKPAELPETGVKQPDPVPV